MVIDDAMVEHVDTLALITSGNAGYSLARLAEGTGIRVVCIIDKTVEPHIKEHLKKLCRIIEADLSQKIFQNEDVYALARETSKEVIWDVTNGYHAAFRSIIKEIKKEEPDWLITPVGSGEAYVGLYEGMKKYKMKTKLVGVGVHQLQDHRLELRKDPSIADKLYTPYTPYKRRIEAILKEGQFYIQLSERQISDAYEKVSDIISCEPSSATVFAALLRIDIKKDSKVIVINSGKGVWKS